ncbi:MAG: biotin--[acetyl-CoA-carboxylase] ligase [Acetobacteraceae bacterium]|nr:biotin--[acetyl-CoA-carboxylase] ligase [Acetobacteraceae bacterium]
MTGAANWRLQVFEALPSTQNLVQKLAEAGEPAGLAVLARRQTAGRGQGVRVWASPAGNLHLSVLLRPRGAARDLPGWALLFAVALREAASELVPAARLRLKWPNDLLLDGAKCAGVLTEAELAEDGSIAQIVAGFGVNLAHAPALEGRETAALGDADVEGFARVLLDRIAAWTRIRLTEGFAPVRAAWIAAGPERGALLTLKRDGAGVTGRYEGLAEDGALLLSTGGRVHAFHAGEIEGR